MRVSLEVVPSNDAVAIFVILPASRSACVTVCVACIVALAPGANGPTILATVNLSSLITKGPASDTFPLFVTS